MHEMKFIHENIEISVIVTKQNSTDISYTNFIEFNSNTRIIDNCKSLKFKNEQLIIKNIPKLTKFNSEIKLLKVECNNKNKNISMYKLYLLLKKFLPSIFDRKYIIKRNLQMIFENDFEHIYDSACKILSEDEVKAMKLHERINYQIDNSEEEQNSICEFDILSSDNFEI